MLTYKLMALKSAKSSDYAVHVITQTLLVKASSSQPAIPIDPLQFKQQVQVLLTEIDIDNAPRFSCKAYPIRESEMGPADAQAVFTKVAKKISEQDDDVFESTRMEGRLTTYFKTYIKSLCPSSGDTEYKQDIALLEILDNAPQSLDATRLYKDMANFFDIKFDRIDSAAIQIALRYFYRQVELNAYSNKTAQTGEQLFLSIALKTILDYSLVNSTIYLTSNELIYAETELVLTGFRPLREEVFFEIFSKLDHAIQQSKELADYVCTQHSLIQSTNNPVGTLLELNIISIWDLYHCFCRTTGFKADTTPVSPGGETSRLLPLHLAPLLNLGDPDAADSPASILYTRFSASFVHLHLHHKGVEGLARCLTHIPSLDGLEIDSVTTQVLDLLSDCEDKSLTQSILDNLRRLIPADSKLAKDIRAAQFLHDIRFETIDSPVDRYVVTLLALVGEAHETTVKGIWDTLQDTNPSFGLKVLVAALPRLPYSELDRRHGAKNLLPVCLNLSDYASLAEILTQYYSYQRKSLDHQRETFIRHCVEAFQAIQEADEDDIDALMCEVYAYFSSPIFLYEFGDMLTLTPFTRALSHYLFFLSLSAQRDDQAVQAHVRKLMGYFCHNQKHDLRLDTLLKFPHLFSKEELEEGFDCFENRYEVANFNFDTLVSRAPSLTPEQTHILACLRMGICIIQKKVEKLDVLLGIGDFKFDPLFNRTLGLLTLYSNNSTKLINRIKSFFDTIRPPSQPCKSQPYLEPSQQFMLAENSLYLAIGEKPPYVTKEE